jgi:uncharacterized protein YktA (UPF0223 family)
MGTSKQKIKRNKELLEDKEAFKQFCKDNSRHKHLTSLYSQICDGNCYDCLDYNLIDDKCGVYD